MLSPTTSSPDASRPPELPAEALVLADYTPAESAEAMELEASCVQGERYPLAFRRETFHRRAESFALRRIVTARLDGVLAGIGAAAIKEVSYRGRPARAAFFFDFRVSPRVRGTGVGRRLTEALLDWASARSELAYTYVVGDNTAAGRVGRRFGTEAGGYAYLVYPAFRALPFEGRLEPTTVEELHAEAWRRAGPWDLAADPLSEGRTGGHVASWLLEGPHGLAGCSAWTTKGILEEVVVSLPPLLRAARALLTAGPLTRLPLPRLPAPGEALRSWYLFDHFASSPRASRDLLRAVSAEALGRGIDWLHLVHAAGDPRAAAPRADVPRPFGPVVSYRLFLRHADGSPVLPVRRLLVDPRDL